LRWSVRRFPSTDPSGSETFSFCISIFSEYWFVAIFLGVFLPRVPCKGPSLPFLYRRFLSFMPFSYCPPFSLLGVIPLRHCQGILLLEIPPLLPFPCPLLSLSLGAAKLPNNNLVFPCIGCVLFFKPLCRIPNAPFMFFFFFPFVHKECVLFFFPECSFMSPLPPFPFSWDDLL